MGTHVEPLLLIGPSRDYGPGDEITVDGRPAIIRRVLMDTGTVLRAEIEVYESREARDSARRHDTETTHTDPSELDGWRVGDDVTVRQGALSDRRRVMNGRTVGVIERIDPNHGLGRWPYLVVFPRGGGFCWSAAEWLTRVSVNVR